MLQIVAIEDRMRSKKMKNQVKIGQAGTLESSDVLVIVRFSPQQKGREIELESPSKKCFGKLILKKIEETLNFLGIKDIYLKAQDRGALDCTISARVETAVKRALKSKGEIVQ